MVEPKTPRYRHDAEWLRATRNWGRWGHDDQKGAINLITPAKTAAAAALVRTGQTISLSRPVSAAMTGAVELSHEVHQVERPEGEPPAAAGAGSSYDQLSLVCHGQAMTHIDALCHAWDAEGLWNGRDPAAEITATGARFGGLEQWKDGIVTRGVLLDVPRYRGVSYVTPEEPVTGEELFAIAEAQGVQFEPGDALVLYCGRESFSREHGPYGGPQNSSRPGVHVSCLEPLREWDCAVLAWDMMDEKPNAYGLPWGVHAAIYAFGVALIDNALLEPVAEACRDQGRWEFLLSIAPMHLVAGTGSTVNPIAIF